MTAGRCVAVLAIVFGLFRDCLPVRPETWFAKEAVLQAMPVNLVELITVQKGSSVSLQGWSGAWVAEGCPGGSAPPGTNLDDTFATYSTNYLIAVVGIAAAVSTSTSAGTSKPYKILSFLFFFLTGLGYGISGYRHHILDVNVEVTRSSRNMFFESVSFTLTVLGTACLALLMNHLTSQGLRAMILDGIVVLVFGAVSLQTMIAPNILLVGVITIVGLLYAAGAWAAQGKLGRALSMFLCVAGLLTQVVLAPKCGGPAYETCFADCPLPAPQFNHNALFHVLYGIGLLGAGVFMKHDPEQFAGEVGDHEPSDDDDK